MFNCETCGQATNDAPASFIRHEGACTCIRCEDCDVVIGDTIETDKWNREQKLAHSKKCCTAGDCYDTRCIRS